MKILVISHEYPPVGGGGAAACRALTECFAGDGHTVDLITVLYGSAPEREDLGGLRIFRVPARRADPDHCSLGEMLDYLVKADRVAERLARQEAYDICLTFFGLPAGPIARRLRRRYGLPYVIRFGGGDIPGFQDRFALLYRLTAAPLRSIWRDAQALVANSEGLRRFALSFCSRYPVQVIHNGVDTARFTPGPPPEERRIRLLTVSRLVERKGLQDLIPCLPELREKTGRSLSLTVVGDGPYREKLERLAGECGAEDMVVFVGHCGREGMPSVYRNADVFVFPSHREGMPNAVLEAMAAGLPVVMRADCQGAEELVRGNGILAAEDLSGALETLLMLEEDELRAMGERSRMLAETEFTWQAAAEKYESLMAGIIMQGETTARNDDGRSTVDLT